MVRSLLILAAACMLAIAASYQSEIESWRRAREERLKAEDGWLTVAGLFWLREGANSFGKSADNDIVLPDGPPQAGSFNLSAGKVTVTMNASTRAIANDSADAVKVGRLVLLVIKRSDKFGIRLKDPESANRRNFHGLEYYPPKEEYRVTARFVAEPKQIPILNILGQTEPSESPGYAVFRMNGKELRVRPILEAPGAKELFYIFKDQTAGKETYPAGRYLYSDLPKDGQVILDFNKAYNPPCSFTDYATCPLPPRENHLDVRIEAGEKKYH
jgi:uncharacterized protein